MRAPERDYYIDGREHSAIKHVFLKKYLPSLAFKTMQHAQGEDRKFIYVDGFTGPWQARDEEFRDTSFGVALAELNKVSHRLKGVPVQCVFCEEREDAFRELELHVRRSSGAVSAVCLHGRFEDNISQICRIVGRRGFLFAFIDPTGFRVDSKSIAELVSDRWSEVLFNFMSAFIQRFPDLGSVESAYGALLADLDWKKEFAALPVEMTNEDKVFLLFQRVIKRIWKFRYSLDLPVKRPNKDQIYYRLAYGTRSPHGVVVFRDAQAKAELEGFAVAIESQRMGQLSFLDADDEAALVAKSVGVGSKENLAVARKEVERIVRNSPNITFLEMAAVLLETVPVQMKHAKQIVVNLAHEGKLRIGDPASHGTPRNQSRLLAPG